MSLPASQYSVLDAERIERVDDNTFRCYVYTFKFFAFEVCPVLLVRVEEQPDGCCIKLLSCKVVCLSHIIEFWISLRNWISLLGWKMMDITSAVNISHFRLFVVLFMVSYNVFYDDHMIWYVKNYFKRKDKGSGRVFFMRRFKLPDESWREHCTIHFWIRDVNLSCVIVLLDKWQLEGIPIVTAQNDKFDGKCLIFFFLYYGRYLHA